MQNKCANCGALVAAGQIECNYCGAAAIDPNESLLRELLAIKRDYELAMVRGNKIEMAGALADEYIFNGSDAGEKWQVTRAELLERDLGNDNFVSYGISKEELLQRQSDSARIRFVETTVYRRRKSGETEYEFLTYPARVTSDFVRRNGRWQLISEYHVTLDDEGNEYQ